MRLTARWPGSGGRLDPRPEDFEVEEQLPYAPTGEGEHVFLRVRKRGLDTLEAARRLARHFGVVEGPAAVGIAGLKDRHAVAAQWFSLPWPAGRPLPDPGPIDAEGSLTLLDARLHPHKLRRGHVAENRFVVTVRGVPPGGTDRARALLDRLRVTGAPNPFGPQRFGRDGDNATRARAILEGRERASRDRRLTTLLFSALQSELFNDVLEARVTAGLLTTAVAGDRMVKHATGGQFVVDDPAVEQPRVDGLEISPTGPLFGKKTPPTRGLAAELEAAALAARGVTLDMARRLGPGARRPLRYPIDPSARIEPCPGASEPGLEAYRLVVRLPAGAYATALLDELVHPEGGPLTRGP